MSRVIAWIMMGMMPCGIVVVEIGVVPRVIPYMTIEIPARVAPMMSVVIAIVIAMMSPIGIPTHGIVHHIIPIIPVAPCGEDIGIHAIIVYIPFPAGPQGTSIHHIPIERTAHRNGVARIAETDDAHGILIVSITAVKAADPTLITGNASETQGIGVHPHRVAIFGDEHKTLIIHGKL